MEETAHWNKVLHFLKLSSVFYCRSELAGDWGIDLPPLEGTMMIHIAAAGTCKLSSGGHEITLKQGELALVPHGDGHRILSMEGKSAINIFDLERKQISHCYEELIIEGQGEKTLLLCGVIRMEHPGSRYLVKALPSLIHLQQSQIAFSNWLEPTLQIISSEAKRPMLGGETIITRLADILVIQAIRTWIALHPQQKGWLTALCDPKIGKALLLLHNTPGHPWTIEEVGKQTGMSRAALALRFHKLVGEPMLTYLTRWRMYCAFVSIRDGQHNIPELAESLGYQSEAAFRRTFKKVIGTTPGETRRANTNQHPL